MFHREFLFHSGFFLNSPNGEEFLNSLRTLEREELSQTITEAESRFLLNDFFHWKDLPASYQNRIKLLHFLDQILPIDSQVIETEYQKNKNFIIEIPEDLLQKFYSNDLNFDQQELIYLINFFRFTVNDDEEFDCILLYLIKEYNIDDLSGNIQLFIKNKNIYIEERDSSYDRKILLPLKYNSFRILNWLNNIDQLDKQKYFKWVCINGYLNIAQWLYNLDVINIHDKNDEIFRKTCLNGHLNVAQWLYSLGEIDIHIYDDAAFRWTCKNGHLNIAQWLYSLGEVDVHAGIDAAFQEACRNGYLDLAQWLYNFDEIDIHIFDEFIFRGTCKNGHLNTAQWLYNLDGINIHAQDNEVFKNSSLEIQEWLKTL